MVGSGVPLDPEIREGFGAMTHTEMEEAINNSDRRLLTIEQILPTLATKTDLERFATKVDPERVTRDLRGEIADARREAMILIESVRDEVRVMADGFFALRDALHELTRRLEAKGVI